MDEKRRIYATFGVPEYAVVDPAQRTLTYYRLLSPGQYTPPQVYSEPATLTFACLPTIPLAIAALFAAAPDTTLEVE